MVWSGATQDAHAAKSRLVILDFSGSGGEDVRAALVRALSKNYQIMTSDDLLDACDELGIELKPGINLAKAATKLNAVAVIGGKMQKRKFRLAIFSPQTGRPLLKQTVTWRGKKALSQSLTLIERGIERAQAAGTAETADTGSDEGDAAEGANEGDTEESSTEETAETEEGGEPQEETEEEDHGARAAEDTESSTQSSSSESDEHTDADQDQEKTVKKKSSRKKSPYERGEPRLNATVGLGMWNRSFNITGAPDQEHPKFGGTTSLIQLALRIRPLAFLVPDSFAANLFLQVRYQTRIIFKSSLPGVGDGTTPAAPQEFGTSLNELMLEVGYNWIFLSSSTSPRLDLSMGFGSLGFGIDWGAETPRMPNASYSYVSVGGLVRWPVHPVIGPHALFNYRIVLGSNDVQDDTNWYGPGSISGWSFGGGLSGSYSYFTYRVEYTLTKFGYSFTDPVGRQQAGKRAAASVSDAYNAVIVSGGVVY